MPIGCSRNRSLSEPWKARVVGAFDGGRFHGVMTAENFAVREVSADKAYASARNYDAIDRHATRGAAVAYGRRCSFTSSSAAKIFLRTITSAPTLRAPSA
jgi:hypothetical protein